MQYTILAGSYSDQVYTLSFDSDTPSLSLTSSVTVGHHPSWITQHPKDPSLVFAGVEQADGKVATLKFDETGKGSVIGEVPSGGADPCTLVPAGEELIVGNVSCVSAIHYIRRTKTRAVLVWYCRNVSVDV